MAKTLWLLRHAKTLEDPPPGGRDRDRRLSKKGEAAAAALGELITAGSLGQPAPGLVLVSPAVRTQQTAALAFAGLAPGARLVTDARLYHATPDDVVEILRELSELDEQVVSVVGHNPTIHCLSLDLVSELSLDGPHPALNAYPPGTLSILELPIDRGSDLAVSEGRLALLR